MAWDSVHSVSAELATHPLWMGSSEALLLENDALRYDHLKSKVERLSQCDDRTSVENSFLKLMQAELDEMNETWSFD